MNPPGKTHSTTRKLFALSLSIALAMSGVGLIIWLASGLLLGLVPIFAWRVAAPAVRAVESTP